MNSRAVCVQENCNSLNTAPAACSLQTYGPSHSAGEFTAGCKTSAVRTLFQKSPLTPARVSGLEKQINRHRNTEIMLPAPFSTRLKLVRGWYLWRNSASACGSLTRRQNCSLKAPHGAQQVHMDWLPRISTYWSSIFAWMAELSLYLLYVSMCYRAMQQDSTLRLKVFWRTYLCLKNSWRPRKYLAGFTRVPQKSRSGVQHDQMIFYEYKCLVLDINTSRRRKNSRLSMHFLRNFLRLVGSQCMIFRPPETAHQCPSPSWGWPERSHQSPPRSQKWTWSWDTVTHSNRWQSWGCVYKEIEDSKEFSLVVNHCGVYCGKNSWNREL